MSVIFNYNLFIPLTKSHTLSMGVSLDLHGFEYHVFRDPHFDHLAQDIKRSLHKFPIYPVLMPRGRFFI